MRVALPSQRKLDAYWAAKKSGVTRIDALQAVSGLTKRAQTEVEKGNWRCGYDCNPERKATFLSNLRAYWSDGLTLHEAARKAGVCYTDAAIEYRSMMERFRDMKREEAVPGRPKHITAEPYSDHWYLQQQEAFAAAMRAAHPELFGVMA